MASSKWKNPEEIKKYSNKRKIIFWGASADWVDKTIRKCGINPCFIVDKNQKRHNTIFLNYKVQNPILLKNNKKKYYVVICTRDYEKVEKELEKFSFISGSDYCCSPLLNERKNLENFKKFSCNFLFTSPLNTYDDKNGGGLYYMSLKTKKIKKVFNGKGRGLCKSKKNIFWIDMYEGIKILDLNLKEQGIIKVPFDSEPHGLAIDEKNQILYVGQPGRDSIGEYSILKKKKINEYFISSKWKKNKKDNHHINDLTIFKNKIYVSCFSITGNFPNDIYDGGVISINRTNNKQEIVIKNLWMPHSINFFKSSLHVLDSMEAYLKNEKEYIIGTFNGFLRGMDFKKKYFLMGTSEHRYPEKLKSTSKNIQLSCGVYLFDPINHISKFYEINNTNIIHDILII